MEEAHVNSSKELRKNAENCAALAEAADSGPNKKRYTRLATAWNELADTQAWLDGEVDNRPAAATGSATVGLSLGAGR
jgi:hypothetical protein